MILYMYASRARSSTPTSDRAAMLDRMALKQPTLLTRIRGAILNPERTCSRPCHVALRDHHHNAGMSGAYYVVVSKLDLFVLYIGMMRRPTGAPWSRITTGFRLVSATTYMLRTRYRCVGGLARPGVVADLALLPGQS